MNTPYQAYKTLMQEIADINHSIALLHWDQEVNMPKKGSPFRAQQLATLSRLSHEKSISAEMKNLLTSLRKDEALSVDERKNVEESWNDFERKQKLPIDFVVELSKAISSAYHAWIEARNLDSFALFEKDLENIVRLKRIQAEYLGFKEHPYDALLDEFEPGQTTGNLEELFKDVKFRLLPLINEIKSNKKVSNSCMFDFYEKEKQWEFGLDLLNQMGYDFEAGRQDVSEHPFTITFSPLDVRVTTRIDEKNLATMIWSCIHEGGHALYEQGLKAENYGLPAGQAISLGIHESQSRLWENNVGRSRPYWKANFPKLKKMFIENLGNVSVNDFYQAMNVVKPSLIRVEADELTYHLHIMIRFEIEKALIEGSLEVKDVSEMWNTKYKNYLGADVPSAKKGVLQDIHWSHGSFGYFPTYSLGSFYAAQFFNKAKQDIPGLEKQIETGNLEPLFDWLREKIHQHGRLFKASELCETVTGEQVNFDYFLAYAKHKYKEIYGVEEQAIQ